MKYLLLGAVAVLVADLALLTATDSPTLCTVVMMPVSWWLAGLADDADLEARQ